MTELETVLFDALKAGVEMRAAQKRYFKCRPGPDKQDALSTAKLAETRFDIAANRALHACNDVMGEGR